VWVSRVCPKRRRQKAISALREGWLAVAQGRGKDLMSACLFAFEGRAFHCWVHRQLMKEWMKDERL